MRNCPEFDRFCRRFRKRVNMLRRLVGPLAALAVAIAIVRGTASATDLAPCQDSASAEYLQALSVADEFLAAWMFREEDKGIALVSAGLRKTVSDDKLREYVSGLSDPYHCSFVVGPGVQPHKGEQGFEFPVTFFFLYNGESTGGGYKTSIKIGRTKDCDTHTQGWCVQSLPSSYDSDVDR